MLLLWCADVVDKNVELFSYNNFLLSYVAYFQ